MDDALQVTWAALTAEAEPPDNASADAAAVDLSRGLAPWARVAVPGAAGTLRWTSGGSRFVQPPRLLYLPPSAIEHHSQEFSNLILLSIELIERKGSGCQMTVSLYAIY
jgi:hypothetical protein